ncbi:MAG: GNAT family N-acetyltransferase [Actinobacteria bacterium]|nr:GNAT family N-acetyltransferase [Actinomycetota bacterium]
MNDLYELRVDDIPRAGAVLAAAFADDPLWERVFSGESEVTERRCALFETPVRYCRRYGRVLATSSGLEGVVAWVPGERATMTFWRLLRSGALLSGMRMGTVMARKTMTVFGPLEADRRDAMKGRRFIHVQVLGVQPESQGRGLGGRLVRAAIRESEASGLALYLETETEANVEMYRRFGFHVVKRIVLPGIGLPMWEMVRPAGRETIAVADAHALRSMSGP